MRKLKLRQVTPEYPKSLFKIVEEVKRDNHWEVKIQDATDENDCPEFEIKSQKNRKFDPQEIADAGMRECAESRGIVTVTEIQNGIPVFSAVYTCDSRWATCRKSTDQDRAKTFSINFQNSP
jgi:hypothetical protein